MIIRTGTHVGNTLYEQTGSEPTKQDQFIGSTTTPEWAATLVALIQATSDAATLPEELRGDGPCDICGTLNNIVWFTDDVLWNEVVRTRFPDGDPLCCIPCFVNLVSEHGLCPTGWRLVPDWHWETQVERYKRTGKVE